MTLNVRKKRILSWLAEADSYVRLEEFTKKWKLSKSTVYRDLSDIDKWLEKQNLQPVCRVPAKGLYLMVSEKALVKEKLGRAALGNDYSKTPEERAAWLGVLLLTREEPFFQGDLAQRLKVSRTTVRRDLKRLEELLTSCKLQLQLEKDEGYHIIGDEKNKRKLLVRLLGEIHPFKESDWIHASMEMHESNLNLPVFSLIDAARIYQILFESENILQTHFPAEIIEILSIHLLFLLKRYKMGKMVSLDPVEKVVLMPSPEYQAAKFIGKQMEETFNLVIPDDELCYISVLLMGAKTGEYMPGNVGEEDLVLLKNVIKRMVTDFEEDCLLAFRNREILEQSLYFHLKSAYYRIIHDQKFENPLSQTIINNYPRLFHETKKVIHHLEEAIATKIPDDEIALITMHFGGWIESTWTGA